MDAVTATDLRIKLEELTARVHDLERVGQIGSWQIRLARHARSGALAGTENVQPSLVAEYGTLERPGARMDAGAPGTPASEPAAGGLAGWGSGGGTGATDVIVLSEWLRRTSGLGAEDNGAVTLDQFMSLACFEDEADTVQAVLDEAIIERMPFTMVHRLRRAGTSDFVWIRHSAEPRFDGDGRLVGFAGVARRIDHEVEARRERSALHETLQRVQRDESAAYLASGLAHEVSNLLQPPLLLCELTAHAVRNADYSTVADRLTQIQASIEKTAEVVKATLEFARLESEELLPIVIGDLFDDLHVFLDPKLLGKVTFQVDASERERAFLGTRTGVVQVALNILKNASEASADDSPILLAAEIEAGVVPGDEVVVIDVVDSGPGFSAEALSRAFDPLFTTRFGSNGTGLGLAVVRTMVERWGGRVEISNNPNGGACVELRIPAVPQVR